MTDDDNIVGVTKVPEKNEKLMTALMKNSVEAEDKKVYLIPRASIRRILRTNGIDRISSDALFELHAMLVDVLNGVSRDLIRARNHRDSKTVSKKDVDFIAS
jgi:histone H3/H4